MKIIFAGTPPFAATALESLHGAGHEIALVLTQPDRAAGRGLKASPSAVKQVGCSLSLQVEQPPTLRDPVVHDRIAQVGADVMVVAAYGLILPPEVLELPRWGCLNIHASLLPRWRGAAPIQRAILAGDLQTGVCIMQMDQGLDTGPVLLTAATPIEARDTAQTLHDRLATLGAKLIVEALGAQRLEPVPQEGTHATYAAKIEKREAQIRWDASATEIDRHVRAFNPVPGATTVLRGSPLKVWTAMPVESAGPLAQPGCVVHVGSQGVDVACGDGVLRLLCLQRAGGRRLEAAAFLAGAALEAGERLGMV